MVVVNSPSTDAISPISLVTKDRNVKIPKKKFQELADLELNYPGWERDYEEAREAFQMGSIKRFEILSRKLQDKQRVFEDYRMYTRLNDLAALELAYPGCDEDREKVEEWGRTTTPNDKNMEIFHDKLEGLKNKNRLYLGDRSNPTIIELDKISFSFPGWEKEYEIVISAFCDSPGQMLDDAFHRIKEKQNIFDGNRSHWRLVALDSLNLTYSGFEDDLFEVEFWHLENADKETNKSLFEEALEGLREEQEIHKKVLAQMDGVQPRPKSKNETREETDSVSLTSSSSIDSVDIEVDRCYRSISESLKKIEEQKKAMIGSEERNKRQNHQPGRTIPKRKSRHAPTRKRLGY